MKKLIVALLLGFCCRVYSQPAIKYTNNELFTLARVWGLMKYYNPAISQGKLDWDSVLINTLKSPVKKSVSATVQDWLNLAAKTPFNSLSPRQLKDCDSITNRNYDISWIKYSSLLSGTQQVKLYTMVAKPANVGYYWSSPEGSARYSRKNEKTYPDQTAPYRLLNLFRIWNVLEYFYPYKYRLKGQWTQILSKSIPKFVVADDSIAYACALTQLCASYNDTHAAIEPTYLYDIFGHYGAPFNTRVINGQAVITKIIDSVKCAVAGLSYGDVISRVDGKTIAASIQQNKQYIASSNPSAANRDAFYYLFTSRDSIMHLQGTKSNGKPFSIAVKRIKRTFDNEWDKAGAPELLINYQGKSYDFTRWDAQNNKIIYSGIASNIGYIDFGLLPGKDVDSVMTAMKNTKGIIFDMRGYNQGNVLKLFYYLLPKPVQFGICSYPVFAEPGKFYFTPYIIGGSDYTYIGKNNPDYYKGKVVVLINEDTQSVMEMWSMLFKCVPNVTFIGSQTAGADGNMTAMSLTSGREMIFSGSGIYYPGGRETQGVGIVPDILLKPTIKDIQAKGDVLAEQAFKLISP